MSENDEIRSTLLEVIGDMDFESLKMEDLCWIVSLKIDSQDTRIECLEKENNNYKKKIADQEIDYRRKVKEFQENPNSFITAVKFFFKDSNQCFKVMLDRGVISLFENKEGVEYILQAMGDADYYNSNKKKKNASKKDGEVKGTKQ